MTTHTEKIPTDAKITLVKCYLRYFNAGATPADLAYIEEIRRIYPEAEKKLYKETAKLFDNELLENLLNIKVTDPKFPEVQDAVLAAMPREGLSYFWAITIVVSCIVVSCLALLLLYGHLTYGWKVPW